MTDPQRFDRMARAIVPFLMAFVLVMAGLGYSQVRPESMLVWVLMAAGALWALFGGAEARGHAAWPASIWWALMAATAGLLTLSVLSL